ncbi:MAG: hypothetical protein WC740_07120 [Verrucomicrobiia bacterium]
MSAKIKRFIVVSLSDSNSWGYNEHTLPLLLRLVDSSMPDARSFTHLGVVAYFLTSPQALVAVETLITQAGALRDSDSRFATLSIGLAEGELLGEFDWLGRLKKNSIVPLGTAYNEAVLSAEEPQKYKETLRVLRERLHGVVRNPA